MMAKMWLDQWPTLNAMLIYQYYVMYIIIIHYTIHYIIHYIIIYYIMHYIIYYALHNTLYHVDVVIINYGKWYHDY